MLWQEKQSEISGSRSKSENLKKGPGKNQIPVSADKVSHWQESERVGWGGGIQGEIVAHLYFFAPGKTYKVASYGIGPMACLGQPYLFSSPESREDPGPLRQWSVTSPFC